MPVYVVVATDGCTDATVAVVARYASRGVRLVELARVGKAAALTAAVKTSTADVLVFSDANGILAVDALEALVRPLADPTVGGVAGDQRYLPEGGEVGGVGHGERAYWSYDRMLKGAESRAGNVVSATGALYAIRRGLFDRVPEGVTDDFYVSTGVIAAGRRLVFAEDALVYEEAASSSKAEWGRKVRIMTRGFQAVLMRRELLDPRRHGYYAAQLLGHKVLRRLMVFPLLVLLLASVLGGRRHALVRALAAVQVAGYAAGAAGLVLGRTQAGCPKPLALPSYFCLVNAASLRAILNIALGRRIDRWAWSRRVEPVTASRGTDSRSPAVPVTSVESVGVFPMWQVVLVSLVGVAAGLTCALSPLIGVVLAIVLVLAVAAVLRPDYVGLLVVAIIYSNAAVVATRLHGLPTLLTVAVPVALLVPLAHRILVRRQPLVVPRVLPLLIVFGGIQAASAFGSDVPLVSLVTLVEFGTEGLVSCASNSFIMS